MPPIPTGKLVKLLWSLQNQKVDTGALIKVATHTAPTALRAGTTGVVAPEGAGDSYPVLGSAFLTREVFKEILSYSAFHSWEASSWGPRREELMGSPWDG